MLSDALPYTRGARIPRLYGVKNCLNNYFAMYKRLTRSCIRYVHTIHVTASLRISATRCYTFVQLVYEKVRLYFILKN